MKIGSILNKIFGKAFIKNLKTSVDRKKYIENECNLVNLEYEIFEAVDGKLHYDADFTIQHGNYHLVFPTSAGYMGNQITSYNVVTHAIALNAPSVMMFDDDCILSHTLNVEDEILKSIEINLPSDWDIVILGDIAGAGVDNSIIYYHKCLKHSDAAGSHGIAINNKIYAELQALYADSKWLNDGAIGRLIDLGKNVYKILPSICRQDRSVFSDIAQAFH
jgi:GR25 family glycosyltransferase involved in LPS biosynthesis